MENLEKVMESYRIFKASKSKNPAIGKLIPKKETEIK